MMNTPIEILEMSFPVRVEQYALVPDSGGAGSGAAAAACERVWRMLGRPAQMRRLLRARRDAALRPGRRRRRRAGARVEMICPDGARARSSNSKGALHRAGRRAGGDGGAGLRRLRRSERAGFSRAREIGSTGMSRAKTRCPSARPVAERSRSEAPDPKPAGSGGRAQTLVDTGQRRCRVLPRARINAVVDSMVDLDREPHGTLEQGQGRDQGDVRGKDASHRRLQVGRRHIPVAHLLPEGVRDFQRHDVRCDERLVAFHEGGEEASEPGSRANHCTATDASTTIGPTPAGRSRTARRRLSGPILSNEINRSGLVWTLARSHRRCLRRELLPREPSAFRKEPARLFLDRDALEPRLKA